MNIFTFLLVIILFAVAPLSAAFSQGDADSSTSSPTDRSLLDSCDGTQPIGTTCADGTIYAGFSPDGHVPMFTTPADAGLFAWNDADSTQYAHFGDTTLENCTGTEASCRTGRHNTAVLVGEDSNKEVEGVQPHRAARYCHCLGKPPTGHCAGDPTGGADSHGHDDWYLPAQDELNVLYINLARDGETDVTPGNSFGFNTTSSFPAGFYWSSSEDFDNKARRQSFFGGSQNSANKLVDFSVRCVRR